MTALSTGNKTSSCGSGGWVGPVFKGSQAVIITGPQNAVNITRLATVANT